MNRNAEMINKKYSEYFFPTVLTVLASNIAVIVDSIFVGRILGGDALAALNLMMPILQLYFSITILLGLGASTIISIEKGKRNNESANRIFTTVFFLILLVSIVLIIVQTLFIDNICSVLTESQELRGMVKQYYIPIIVGTPITLMTTSAVYFIRSDGRPKFASSIIIISNSVNLLFDIILMRGFGMGILGSSIATVVGNIVGFIVLSTHFAGKKSTLHFDFSLLKHMKEFIKNAASIVSLGFSGALGTLLITVKMAVLNYLVQHIAGKDGVVAYAICLSCQMFVSLFISGASQTMMPLVGVFLGEHDYDSIRYVFRRAFRVLTISSLMIIGVVEIAPQTIAMFYGINEQATMVIAVQALRISVLSFLALSYSFLFLYYFMAIERKAISMAISILDGVVIAIPMAYIFSHFMGITGIWISIVVSEVGTLFITLLMIQYVRKKSNGQYQDFYLLDKNDENEIVSLSFKGTEKNASMVSQYICTFLENENVDKKTANMAALAVEEMTVNARYMKQKKDKSCDIDVRINVNEKETILSIRDNGEEFDPCQYEDENDFSNISLLKKISKDMQYTRLLGFNQTTIIIER